MKGKIGDSKKVLMHVSQDVVIEKDIDGAIEFVDKVIDSLTEQIKLMNDRLYQLDLSLQGMSNLIQRGYVQQQ